MTRLLLLGLLVLASLSDKAAWSAGVETKEAAGQPSQAFCIVGYLPDYRLDAVDPAAAELLTDLIYFSLEPGPSGELDATGLSAATLKKLQDLKDRGKLRMLVTVGGWNRSKGFPQLAADAVARKRFIGNLARLCQENHFDGVDFDWEHPATRAEEEGYASLLIETKQAFKPRGWIVTIALAAWQNIDRRALEAVDRIHLMAYDHNDRRHSTLERARADVDRLLKRGADPGKICLGLPFYGRNMEDRSQALSYADLLEKHRPSAATDEAGGFYFNGPATVQKKTRYALERGLAGVMIWELGQDARGGNSLLGAIRAARSK
jgi:chitinase